TMAYQSARGGSAWPINQSHSTGSCWSSSASNAPSCASSSDARCASSQPPSRASSSRVPRRQRHCTRFRHASVSGNSTLPAPMPAPSDRAIDQQLLDLADGLGRIEPFRASVGAVHDGVAAIQLERIIQIIEAFAGRFVARIDDPAISLQQNGGPEKTVWIPPVAGARRGAARAQDAFVQAIEFLAVLG